MATNIDLKGLVSQKILKNSDSHPDKLLHVDSSVIFNTNLQILCRSGLPVQYIVRTEIPYHLINSIEYSDDGTLIRLYFCPILSKWITSTNQTIDAKFSQWSSHKDFDTLFWDSFGSLSVLDTFDKSCTYSFILLHPDNIHIITHTRKALIFIEALSGVPGQIIGNLDSFQKPQVICSHFQSIPDKEAFILSIPHLQSKRGIILFSDTTKYILDFQSFIDLKLLRGNHPRIEHRYIQFINRPAKLSLLRQSFPSFCGVFDHIDLILSIKYKSLPPSKQRSFYKSSPQHLFNIYNNWLWIRE